MVVRPAVGHRPQRLGRFGQAGREVEPDVDHPGPDLKGAINHGLCAAGGEQLGVRAKRLQLGGLHQRSRQPAEVGEYGRREAVVPIGHAAQVALAHPAEQPAGQLGVVGKRRIECRIVHAQVEQWRQQDARGRQWVVLFAQQQHGGDGEGAPAESPAMTRS